MKIYISCHSRDLANELAVTFTKAGHEVVSDWHNEPDPRPAADDAEAWRAKWDHNFEIIERADALVVIASAEHMNRTKCVSGGKFVEAGAAMELGVPVYTLWGVENGMMWGATGGHAKAVDELLGMLAHQQRAGE